MAAAARGGLEHIAAHYGEPGLIGYVWAVLERIAGDVSGDPLPVAPWDVEQAVKSANKSRALGTFDYVPAVGP
jgi:hypothetical protein